jgi:hypothetical protein
MKIKTINPVYVDSFPKVLDWTISSDGYHPISWVGDHLIS